ncbi:hypothetical protein HZB88_01575 [archaeon]|nr:hypothetical protein [archaeon]
MTETVLGTAIDFLKDFGFFDVILPFLLVFTIVFGILEKTKIFGMEEVGDKKYPRKNINAMVAFVIGFFVIAAKEITGMMQVAVPQIVLILIALICLIMLIGPMVSGKDELNLFKEHKWLFYTLTAIFLVAVILIFFDVLGWLDVLIEYFSTGGYFWSIIIVFLAVIFGAIAFVVVGGEKKEK